MNDYNLMDIVSALSAVEITLARLGHKIQFGSAVGAAMEVFKDV